MIWLALALTLVIGLGPAPISASAPPAGRVASVRQNGPILRIYLAALDRAPDQTGLQYWTEMNKAGLSLPSIAGYFMESEEFRQKFGSPDDENFVQLVYQNVLDRSADANGLAYWTGLLEGGQSRSAILNGFAQSPEFVAHTASILEAANVETPILSAAAPVLMIGDSIFHGIRILDIPVGGRQLVWMTEEGRHPTALPGLLSTASSQGTLELAPIVVIHLGTNSWSSDYVQMFNREVADLPNHTVFLVNVAADRSWETAANADLAQVVQTNNNVRLIDWNAAVSQKPELLRADGVHPSAAGLRELAQLVDDGVSEVQSASPG